MNIAITISPGQAEYLIRTMQAAKRHAKSVGLSADEYSILLLTSDEEETVDTMKKTMENWTEGEGVTFGDLPSPDVIYFGEVWTIALPVSYEDAREAAARGESE